MRPPAQPPESTADAGLERGGAAARSDQPSSPSIVVATYNVRYAVGSFLITGSLFRRAGLGRPGRRPRLVAGNIRRAARALSGGALMPAADVVALQEADRGTVRAGGRDVARELALALGMEYVRARAATPRDERPQEKRWYLDFEERIKAGEEGDTGVALLSRLPLGDAARVELPPGDDPWRPRLAIAATLTLAGGRLHVFNLHIDPHADIEGRLEQLSDVLARADTRAGAEPVLLLGDFNTLSRRARAATRGLLESRGYTTPLPTGTGTWRAGPLRLHADWIFTRGLGVRRWGVARGLRVSDHWPVWAEVCRGGV